MPESTLSIRNGEARDLAAILDIERASATAAHWPHSIYAAMVGDSSKMLLVAERDARVLGFAAVSKATAEWELENISVAPSARQQGVGRALMHAVLEQAREHQAAEVRQEIRSSNVPAQMLAVAVGFVQQGVRKNYYHSPNEDALLFAHRVGLPEPLAGEEPD